MPVRPALLFALLFSLSACDGGRQRPTGPSTANNCTPRTCVAASCGQFPDGCGGTVNCGECPCVPTTCADTNAQCGQIPDGCGAALDCGTCDPGLNCGGAGPNQCGMGECTPRACVAGTECGQLADGCGGIIDCGGCAAPSTCGGGGAANQCGCAPSTCADLGAQCGAAPDGCGGNLDCGTCPSGQTCGGGGRPNSCGSAPCTPATCAGLGFDCGTADDGCGATLSCGDCTAPATCGGGGASNVCGCMPTTCAAVGAECGDVPNGCGGTLSCGGCTAPLTCGGGGTANACGATCTPDCPSGWTCDNGVCRGGNSQMLDLNIDVPAQVTITGRVTINGQTPTLPPNVSRGCIRVSYVNLDGFSGDSDWACTDDNYTYEVTLWAGDHRVDLERSSSSPVNMPAVRMEAFAMRSFATSASLDINLSVPAIVTIAGTVTVNGQVPTLPPNVNRGCIRVSFSNLDGLSGDSDWACTDDNYAYEVQLWAGDHRVQVERSTSSPVDIPAVPLEIVASRAFGGSASYDVDIGVPNRVTIAGQVTVNGQTPQLPPNVSRGCIRVSFSNLDGLSGDSDWACTDDNYAYEVQLWAGDHRISAERSSSSPVDMPAVQMEITASRPLLGSASLDVDIAAPAHVTVSGRVTVNGQTPTLPPNVNRGCIRVSFSNLDGLSGDSDWACTDDNYTYEVQLWAGDHRLSVERSSSSPVDIPAVPIEITPRRSFGSSSALDVNIPVPARAQVTGRVTLNGQTPTLPPNVNRGCIRVSYTNLDGLSGDSDWACTDDGYTYEVDLWAGAHRITVERSSSSPVHMPAVRLEVDASRGIASSSALDVDVAIPASVTVGGRVTINGQTPRLPANVSRGCIRISFANQHGLSGDSDWACTDDGYSYEVDVWAGDHGVRAERSSSSPVEMPAVQMDVIERIALP